MRILRSLALATLALLAGACATPRTAGEPASVLLVSIDGFHPSYLDRGLTPHLAGIGREGVRAQWMNPSYPTLTFPNHYTLVTGLRPDRHGVVHNTMADPGLGRFSISDRDAVGDARWWGGEPLWVTAEKAGLRTATLFWPGSEAPIQGTRPTHWRTYDGSLPMPARVDTVLQWLGRPAAARPRLVTLYFGALDEAAHAHGPDSAQVDATLVAIDSALGRLLRGLDAGNMRGRVNLVVVSDHGMAPVAVADARAIEAFVDPADATYVTAGEVLGFEPRAGREAAAEARLLGRHDGYACWRKQELPARWHYGTHPRIPPIVCQMDVGRVAMTRQRLATLPPDAARGAHGYDPAHPSMRALFLAQGPAFRRGVELPPFDNVDVYPLLARLVGVEPRPHEGDIAPLLPALE